MRARGVAHAALFGAHARGDNRPDSDIDILIDIAPEAPVGLWEYVAITQYLEDLFPSPVDVANHVHLKPHVRPAAEREAAYCFLKKPARRYSIFGRMGSAFVSLSADSRSRNSRVYRHRGPGRGRGE